jgi:predicted MFS family arabinose efflux permease
MFGLAGTLPMLFVARAISGALTAAALPNCMAYVADITDEASRGKGMGLMGAAMGIGFILGPPAGGLLGHYGHDVPFLVAAGLTALTFAFALGLLRESLRPGSAPSHRRGLVSPVRILREPLAPFFVLAFFVTLTMSGLETTFPFLVQQELKVGAESLGWMLGIMGLAVTLVQGALLGRLINGFGEVTVLTGGVLVNAAGFFLITSIPRMAGMTFALTVAGVGNQLLRPTNASLISKRASTGQGTAIGMMDSMDALGRVCGPFLAGYLYEIGRTLPYYFGALAMSLVFIGIALSRGSARGREAA